MTEDEAGSGAVRVVLVNHTDRVRPEVEMLVDALPTDRVRLSVVLPESCRETFEPGDRATAHYYEARFVPNIRYTIPSTSFFETMRDRLRAADVVHVFGYAHLPSLLASRLSTRFDVATVVTIDAFPGVSWSYGNRVVDAVATAYTHTFARWIFAAADRVVGLGEYLRPDLRRFVGDPDKIRIVPNGVDTDAFRPPSASVPRDEGATNGGAEPAGADPVRLLFVGRLDTVKGISHLLDAVATLRRDASREFRLTLVGDGSRREDYEARCRELGLSDVVSFEGWQSHVRPYYERSDVFVLSSLSEGLPTVVMEAQACGLPVVATDVGGVRELVRGGYVVPRRNPAALAEAIEALAETDLAERGAVARRHVVERYSLASMADAYVDMYERL